MGGTQGTTYMIDDGRQDFDLQMAVFISMIALALILIFKE
jgi:hypothetical protein